MLKTTVAILLLIIAFVGFSVVSVLLRQPDDFAVVAGVGLAVIILLGILGVLARLAGRAVWAMASLAILGAGCTYVPPGHAGIVVNSYGSERGVSDYPIKTGRVNYNPWSEDVLIYPTFMQTGEWSTRRAIHGDLL